VVAKVRERLAVNKQRSHKLHVERFNLKIEGKEQFRVEVSNRFAVLEDLDAGVEINSAWRTISENIKISEKERRRRSRSISHGLTKDAQNY
jgi:hypothetical protein